MIIGYLLVKNNLYACFNLYSINYGKRYLRGVQKGEPQKRMRRPGFEPGLWAWKAQVMPLDHRRR